VLQRACGKPPVCTPINMIVKQWNKSEINIYG
jgi:hypothetical protein